MSHASFARTFLPCLGAIFFRPMAWTFSPASRISLHNTNELEAKNNWSEQWESNKYLEAKRNRFEKP